jgi:zinc/manganese transport system permease protein
MQILGTPLAACLVIGAILAYLGIHVLKREIIFVDIALAQMAAVGAIAAHMLLHVHGDSLVLLAAACVPAFPAALFYAVARRRVSQIPLEAVIGISYAAAAAAALFLVGVAPGGHVHVQHMLAGSILWARGNDVLFCALVFGLIGLLFRLLRRPFGRISDDYEQAVRDGVRVVAWDFVFYTLTGVVVAMAVRLAGVVLVFALLVIPATASALFASRWVARLAIAWATGAAASVLGLLFADRLDFSVGPSVTLFLGVLLIPMAIAKSAGPVWAAGPTVLAAVGLGWLLTTAPQKSGATREPSGTAADLARPTPTCRLCPTGTAQTTEEPIRKRLERARAVTQFEALFDESDDPDVRSEIVCRALRVEPCRGAALAIRFLESEPPLFFGQRAFEAVRKQMRSPLEYDLSEPSTSPENRRTLERIRARYGLDVAPKDAEPKPGGVNRGRAH